MGLLGVAATGAPERRWSFTTRTMGTYATVTLFGADSLGAARRAWLAHRDFARVDSLMTNWTTTSEVARLNREAEAGEVTLDAEVAGVIGEALQVCRDSDGAYDITVEPLVRLWGFLGGPKRVPDSAEVAQVLPRVGYRNLRFDPATRRIRFLTPGLRIDLGSIAKGYGVLAAARTLAKEGVRNALVDISGNMAALGAPPGKAGWVVGIRDPRGRAADVGRLTLKDRALSTSGKYEQFVARDGRQYGHILNPKTGWPAEGLISVTVVAESAETADAWSTAFFALGPGEAKRLSRVRTDLDAVLITPGIGSDTLWVERNLRSRFQLEPSAAPFITVEFY